jgi:hypothetical protein
MGQQCVTKRGGCVDRESASNQYNKPVWEGVNSAYRGRGGGISSRLYSLGSMAGPDSIQQALPQGWEGSQVSGCCWVARTPQSALGVC